MDRFSGSAKMRQWSSTFKVNRTVRLKSCNNAQSLPPVYDRKLTSSNYPAPKMEENITAEIMQTCLTESRESYAEEIIVELQSDGEGDAEVEENVRRIAEWCEKWRQDRLAGNHDE